MRLTIDTNKYNVNLSKYVLNDIYNITTQYMEYRVMHLSVIRTIVLL